MNILVVGAHPDDIAISCSGTISKYINNGEINKCIPEVELDNYLNNGWKLGQVPKDRTERIIYNTQTKSATLFGKQRRGYYYPWVGYNGQGNCSTIYKKQKEDLKVLFLL